MNKYNLADFTDMPEKTFIESLKQIDWTLWETNPAIALTQAHLQLKEGKELKPITKKEEADLLPNNILPILITDKEKKMNLDKLGAINGGRQHPKEVMKDFGIFWPGNW